MVSQNVQCFILCSFLPSQSLAVRCHVVANGSANAARAGALAMPAVTRLPSCFLLNSCIECLTHLSGVRMKGQQRGVHVHPAGSVIVAPVAGGRTHMCCFVVTQYSTQLACALSAWYVLCWEYQACWPIWLQQSQLHCAIDVPSLALPVVPLMA